MYWIDENHSRIDGAPTNEEIKDRLEALGDGGFAILSLDDDSSYMQVSGNTYKDFYLEYHSPEAENMNIGTGLNPGPGVEIDEVVRCFSEFRDGITEFVNRHEWKEVHW